MQAAWAVLRRNGMVPLSTLEQGGMGGGDGGRDCDPYDSNNANGGSSINIGGGGGDGDGGAASFGPGAGGPAGTDKLKAILKLGKRDAVKRLLKQARKT